MRRQRKEKIEGEGEEEVGQDSLAVIDEEEGRGEADDWNRGVAVVEDISAEAELIVESVG